MPSAIFHRSLEKSYPTAIQGNGVFISTADGRKILDGSSGAAVSSVGHEHKDVIDAIVSQIRGGLLYAHTSFFTSDPAEQLAQTLIRNSGTAFSHVTFLGSGSEAVESSLKICRQYHVYNGQPERVNIIGRMHSYHGNTLGALSAGNNPSRRGVFTPILSSTFHHVSRCFFDADHGGLTESEYEDKLIAELEKKINLLGSRTVAAIIVEPVVGATLGSVPPTSTYLPRIKGICEQHGILLIFDEVMCGMGRIGTLHAWQSLGGASPDLQTIGKGLAAGYQPLSAVLMNDKIYRMFESHSKGPNKFTSGHTYQGHSIGCAAALAVNAVIEKHNLLSNVKNMGNLLVRTLQARLPSVFHEMGGSLRGIGLLQTVDFGLLSQKYGGKAFVNEVSDQCFVNGLAVYPCSGSVDAILVCPPFIITETEVETLVSVFIKSLVQVLDRRDSILSCL